MGKEVTFLQTKAAGCAGLTCVFPVIFDYLKLGSLPLSTADAFLIKPCSPQSLKNAALRHLSLLHLLDHYLFLSLLPNLQGFI